MASGGPLSFSFATTVGFLFIVANWILSLPTAHHDGKNLDTGGSSGAPSNSDVVVIAASAWVASTLVLSSLFANPFWRVLVVLGTVASSSILPRTLFPSVSVSLPALFSLLVLIVRMPHLLAGKSQPARGIVFVTGADSGMGYHSSVRLARSGYHVVAGCYAEDSEEKLKAELISSLSSSSSSSKRKDEDGEREAAAAAAAAKLLTTVKLDVTDDQSVAKAADAVKSHAQYKTLGLVGVVQCAGVGYNGPAEYFPLHLYKHQMEVNFYGYVRVMQYFMPLLRESSSRPGARRGRIAFFGTGGGSTSPVPPLLSAYMCSKFAVEALCGSLRLEMQLTNRNIDCCVVNPGFVKPTNLMAGGMELTRKMWKACQERNGDDRAEREYGELLDTFIKYSEDQPGTHVSEVARTVEELMKAHRPLSSYKVGPDSKAAPFVGMLPTGVREYVVKKSMYGKTGSV